MTWQFVPSTVALFVSAGLALAAALLASRRPSTPGSIPFILLILAVAEWDITRALEASAVGLADKILWAKLEYLGIASVPPLWLLFAWSYSARRKPVAPLSLVLLWIVPLLTMLIAATNEGHRLLWTTIRWSSAAAGAHLIYSHGPWFWLAAAFSYVLLLMGSGTLVWAFLRFPGFYRRQAGGLVAGAAVPWAGNLLYLTGRSPVPGMDPTPFAFTIAGLIWFWVLFRFALFDLVPVAHEAVIESMADGVLVLDLHGRILDINPAARQLIGAVPGSPVIGEAARDALAHWPELAAFAKQVGRPQAAIERNTPPGFVDARILPLHTHRGRLTGRLLVLRDITEHKQADARLQASNLRLQSQLRETAALQDRLREEAIRDPLTGLFNRRYLRETLERELARATRERLPLSLVMIDIDHFKRLNDTWGHQAGDRMLQALSALLQAETRAGDVACRYGGEEFVVVLPGATVAVACQRAEGWRRTFQALSVAHDGSELRATLSAGVGAYPADGATADALLAAADQAMYAAKSSGRNQVKAAASDTVSTSNLA